MNRWDRSEWDKNTSPLISLVYVHVKTNVKNLHTNHKITLRVTDENFILHLLNCNSLSKILRTKCKNILCYTANKQRQMTSLKCLWCCITSDSMYAALQRTRSCQRVFLKPVIVKQFTPSSRYLWRPLRRRKEEGRRRRMRRRRRPWTWICVSSLVH